jgi:hypothetical protein
MEILNPSQIGLITEQKCQLYLLEHGFTVLTPLGNYQKYDLVIEKDNRFYRIQVKHSTEKENSFIVRTKYDVRDNGKVRKETYTKEDCDYFMTEFQGIFYLFPVFGTQETKFWLTRPNNSSTSKLAKDYLAEDVLKKL